MDTSLSEILSYIISPILFFGSFFFIRNIFKRFADFTESVGQSLDSIEEIKALNSRIKSLEDKLDKNH